MLKVSNRGIEMPASPIRKLVPYAEAAKKKGITVHHLNIGQPDIATPPQMMDAVKKVDFPVLEYTHSAGNETYRRKLTTYYSKIDIDVSYKNILITTGGSEAIMFSFFACLNPGDEVIIPEPLYANYLGFACEAGITVVSIPSSIESGFSLPKADAFEKVITPLTKAILICNPNNPTGYLYSKEEMVAIGDICKKHQLFLFGDEAYREFVYGDQKATSVMHLQGLEENVVLLDTISKRYSACGARIGAFVTRNKEIYNTALKFAQARLSPPGLEQILGEEALNLPEHFFDAPKAEYIRRRDVLIDRLNKMNGVFCPNPGGAFYAMAKLPIDDCDKFCQWLLEDFSFENQTVMLAPATGFYVTSSLGKSEVRLAYVINQDAINKAMDCLEAALRIYPGRVD